MQWASRDWPMGINWWKSCFNIPATWKNSMKRSPTFWLPVILKIPSLRSSSRSTLTNLLGLPKPRPVCFFHSFWNSKSTMPQNGFADVVTPKRLMFRKHIKTFQPGSLSLARQQRKGCYQVWIRRRKQRSLKLSQRQDPPTPRRTADHR